VLFAVIRLGEGAYGAAIQREIVQRTTTEVAIGAVYTALHRLEKRGLVSARMGEPTAVRGGRRRRYYAVTPIGARVLSASYETLRRMAHGTGELLAALAEGGDV
jgi:DNA-binding PadR family transcriptional regulator